MSKIVDINEQRTQSVCIIIIAPSVLAVGECRAVSALALLLYCCIEEPQSCKWFYCHFLFLQNSLQWWCVMMSQQQLSECLHNDECPASASIRHKINKKATCDCVRLCHHCGHCSWCCALKASRFSCTHVIAFYCWPIRPNFTSTTYLGSNESKYIMLHVLTILCCYLLVAPIQSTPTLCI